MSIMATPEQTAGEDLLVALGNTDIVPRSWRPDGDGVLPDGYVGGDGAGEAVSVRYLNRYAPNARITTYFYVVDVRDRNYLDGDDADGVDVPFYVEEMVESYVADRLVTDEDAQERWSDYERHEHSRCFATESEAEAERDRLAALDSPEDYLWDGTEDMARRR